MDLSLRSALSIAEFSNLDCETGVQKFRCNYDMKHSKAS